MNNIRTSRGQIEETEQIIANLLLATEHIYDLPSINIIDLAQIKSLRELRNDLTKSIFKEGKINTNYHCIWKHLLITINTLKELITSTQDENSLEYLETLKKILNYYRLKYLDISETELEDNNCMRCLEDYIGNKEESKFESFNSKDINLIEEIINNKENFSKKTTIKTSPAKIAPKSSRKKTAI